MAVETSVPESSRKNHTAQLSTNLIQSTNEGDKTAAMSANQTATTQTQLKAEAKD